MNVIAPNIARPIRNPSEEATVKTDVPEQAQRDDRLGRAPLLGDEQPDQHDPDDPEPEDRRRPPRVLAPAPRGQQDDRADTRRQQRRAEIVDRVPLRRRVQVQAEDDDQHRDHAHGQVHVEHPAPRERLDEEAAQQRAGDARHREHGADQAHVAPAVARRNDVGDDRLRAHHQPARAEPLHGAERDQLAHRLAQPAQHRAGDEDQDRDEEHGLAPVHVAELAVERRRGGRREQVGRDHPRQVLEAAELADDRRQRRRHDRLIERGEEHAEHQRGEHGHEGSARQGVIGRGRALGCTQWT